MVTPRISRGGSAKDGGRRPGCRSCRATREELVFMRRRGEASRITQRRRHRGGRGRGGGGVEDPPEEEEKEEVAKGKGLGRWLLRLTYLTRTAALQKMTVIPERKKKGSGRISRDNTAVVLGGQRPRRVVVVGRMVGRYRRKGKRYFFTIS